MALLREGKWAIRRPSAIAQMRRHAPAVFGADTTQDGAPVDPARGAGESGKQRGFCHGSSVGVCVGPAGRSRIGVARRRPCSPRCRVELFAQSRRRRRLPRRPQAAPKARSGAEARGSGCAGAAAGARPAGEQPQLIFSPWTKFCLKGQEANAKQVCFTGKDGRVESGMPVVAAVLIEPENDPKKVLRVTLPLGMSIPPGTRVIVDKASR